MKYYPLLFVVLGVAFINGPTSAQFIGNPFCQIDTILWPNHPMGAQATIESSTGLPVILVDPYVEPKVEQVLGSGGGQAFMRFLLAHKCGNHMNGDMPKLQQLKLLGPYAMLRINPSLESGADCWAANLLQSRGDHNAIRAAATFFLETMGPFSAPGYPTGQQRASTIAWCGGL